MHVFHIKGISGLLVLILAFVGLLALVTVAPAAYMMVLWNGIVYEGFHGPLIGLDQGFLLWGATLVLLKLILKPDIQVEFQNMGVFRRKENPPEEQPPVESIEEAATPMIEDSASKQ